MSFLAPLMLLGVLAVAAPLWIHLHGARRARVVRFSAVDFLLGTDQSVSRRLRIRELLLLIARVLIFLIVPLLLAKPFASCQTEGPSLQRGPQGSVIIIDDGLASGYRVDGDSLLERAKERAIAILGELGPEADVAIISTSSDRTPTQLSRDHLRLRDEIRALETTPKAGDTIDALRRAAQLLEGSAHHRNTVFLLTTGTRATFLRSSGAPWPDGKGPALSVFDVGKQEKLDNVGVAEVGVEPAPGTGPRSLRVTVRIHNYGSVPVDDREARLLIDGESVARVRFSIAAGDLVEEHFSASLAQGKRIANVSVVIDGDNLAADDQRYVVAHLREEVRVLLVNGDPRTVRYEDELFYLEAALEADDSGVRVSEILADGLNDIDLDRFDVVVLANVSALSEERVGKLVRFVAAGGGLLMGTGDNVIPEEYNRTMRPLLPQELASILDVGYGSRGDERALKSLRLEKLDAEHPVFRLFGPDGRALKNAAFHKVHLLGPTTDLESRKVLARYQSGAAALVEATVGRGRVLLLTSTLDRDWNDLSIQTGYVPLIDQAVRYLAKKQLRSGDSDVLVGQAALVSVEASDRRVEIRSPGGRSRVFEGEHLEDRERVRFADTLRPGFYSVSAVDDAGKERDRPESTFAVNVDSALGNLEKIDSGEIPRGGDGTAEISSTHERRIELWHALGASLLLLLCLESLLVLKN